MDGQLASGNCGLIGKEGGVMTTVELTAAVLAARGSVADEPQRLAMGRRRGLCGGGHGDEP